VVGRTILARSRRTPEPRSLRSQDPRSTSGRWGRDDQSAGVSGVGVSEATGIVGNVSSGSCRGLSVVDLGVEVDLEGGSSGVRWAGSSGASLPWAVVGPTAGCVDC
jgi:hypothetical protein